MIRATINSAFFRQSIWMMAATVANSGFMWLVSVVVVRMQPHDLGTFVSLMDVLAQLSIPIAGVLAVFMQRTVAATTEESRRELVGTARGIVGGAIVLWVLVAAITTLWQRQILNSLQLANALGWWLTLVAGLVALIIPTLTGILQGEQKFGWVGLSYIVNGCGRFAGILVAVSLLRRGADGAMAGVLAGNFCTLLMVAWGTRWIWHAPASPFDWKRWLHDVIPLTLGLGAPTYVFTQDMLVVQQHYELAASAAYGAPRVVGRALFFLVGPLIAVMFPKVARSAATAERTNVLAQAAGATALVCGSIALGCTLFPDFMLRLLTLGKSQYAESAWLIPWFAWALLPLALANLLANNLLARKRFAVVPWLVAVAIAYRVTLHYTYWSYLTVILTLGFFSLLLFVVCVVFTIRQPPAGVTRR